MTQQSLDRCKKYLMLETQDEFVRVDEATLADLLSSLSHERDDDRRRSLISLLRRYGSRLLSGPGATVGQLRDEGPGVHMPVHHDPPLGDGLTDPMDVPRDNALDADLVAAGFVRDCTGHSDDYFATQGSAAMITPIGSELAVEVALPSGGRMSFRAAVVEDLVIAAGGSA